MNQYSRKWGLLSTFGGKLAENLAQGLSRDILGYGMPLAESKGYEIVLDVHDEILSETPDDPKFTHKKLSKIMSTVPPWAPGLPLAAAGFEGKRYKKED
jgi:DNA polymerase